MLKITLVTISIWLLCEIIIIISKNIGIDIKAMGLPHFNRKTFNVFPISVGGISFLNVKNNIYWFTNFTFLSIGCFLLLNKLSNQKNFNIYKYILFSWFLIVSINCIQGFNYGLINPITTNHPKVQIIYDDYQFSEQYYDKALLITNPSEYIKNYTSIQSTDSVGVHGRVHPPFTTLFYYLLSKINKSPIFISLVMSFISVLIYLLFLYKILKMLSVKYYAKLILISTVIPGFCIYSLSTIDSIIAGLNIACIYSFIRGNNTKSLILCLCFLHLSTLLSFMTIIIYPVLYLYELYFSNSFKKSLILSLGNMLLLYMYNLIFSYNYFVGFTIASQNNNPHGFWLFNDPYRYFFTRFESLFLIILFSSPFLIYFSYRNLIKSKMYLNNPLTMISIIGISVFFVFLISGVYINGETDRAAQYMYFYFVLPLCLGNDKLVKLSYLKYLSYIMFSQTLLMQMFGRFFY